MKQLRFFMLTIGILFAISGCAYMKTESLGSVQSGTIYQLNSGDFKVIDRVSVAGETTLWFGMVLTGGKGYQALLDEAKKVGGDAIMDYSFDVEQEAVFLFIYNRVRWKATGLAVKLKNHIHQ